MSNSLKLLILYDARRNAYTICDHNLTPEQAKAQVVEWRGKSLNALTVDQNSKHKANDPQDCRTCRRDVARTSGLYPKPRFQRRRE
jgi:hypothetical protein